MRIIDTINEDELQRLWATQPNVIAWHDLSPQAQNGFRRGYLAACAKHKIERKNRKVEIRSHGKLYKLLTITFQPSQGFMVSCAKETDRIYGDLISLLFWESIIPNVEEYEMLRGLQDRPYE